MALERRTLLMVRESMKAWPTFLLEAFRHPAQDSPDQALANNTLKRHRDSLTRLSRTTGTKTQHQATLNFVR
jgi:hypothetical protein